MAPTSPGELLSGSCRWQFLRLHVRARVHACVCACVRACLRQKKRDMNVLMCVRVSLCHRHHINVVQAICTYIVKPMADTLHRRYKMEQRL